MNRSLYSHGYHRDMPSDTKIRIVQAGAQLFRRQGFTGTGVKQIVTEASAPFASLYHFFPGGKEELGAEVIRWSGAMYSEFVIDAFFTEGADPVAATEAAFDGAAATLVESDFADACPIATVALEISSSSEPLRVACADVFTAWIDRLADRFAGYGVADGTARELAVSMLLSLEGAFVLSRALRSTDPVRIAGLTATAAMRNALAEGSR